MTVARVAVIPWYHVIAELVAYPLASESALEHGVVSLDPALKSTATQRLWRDAERALVATTPSLSLDELVGLRDVHWFMDRRGGKEAIPLGRYLRRLARSFLRESGSMAIPDFSASQLKEQAQSLPSQDRSFWRWVSLALPPDLLWAALDERAGGMEGVRTLTPALEQQLRDEGFAEPHLHLGAAVEFPLLWVATLKALASLPESKLIKAFQSPGASLEEGRHLARWLLRAAIARYLLGAYLAWGTASSDSLASFFHEEVRRRIGDEGKLSFHGLLQALLEDLLSGRLPQVSQHEEKSELAHLRSLLKGLTGTREGKLPKRLKDVYKEDPLARFQPAGDERMPEGWLVRQGLVHLESEGGRRDDAFSGVFWQVLRVRCLFYRHIVQRPMTPGLAWFIRTFARLDGPREAIHGTLSLRSALRLTGAKHGLRALEVRVTPKAANLWRLVKSAQAIMRKRRKSRKPAPELGFVVHFSRDRGGKMKEGTPTAFLKDGNADPNYVKNRGACRFTHFYKQKRSEAMELARLLTAFPLTLEWVRGLDLCSDEAGVPLWVMKPLLRYVREVSGDVSKALRREVNREVPPLRMCVHAGEDFVHLLSGLRRLDEAIERLELQPGDRIGHGLSLGVEPRGWAERAGRIVMPVEERLFDLAWEWRWRSIHGGQLTRNRHLLIEREMMKLSEEMFGRVLQPHAVVELIDSLHDEESLLDVGFPHGIGRRRTGRLRWLEGYLKQRDVFERGRELVWVDPTMEIEALEELQMSLRRKVGERELVIEVNPSSNLLIGHLADMGNHPLWRLRPQSKSDDIPPVALIIGSDDPITFATDLRQEYQLLYDALVLRGCSSQQAEEWLEGVRKASLSARFTLPWSGRGVEELPMAEAPSVVLPP